MWGSHGASGHINRAIVGRYCHLTVDKKPAKRQQQHQKMLPDKAPAACRPEGGVQHKNPDMKEIGSIGGSLSRFKVFFNCFTKKPFVNNQAK
ncbi:hypothetical protein [Cedecea neteri]|uniref:hypothetical protein n=1 Tax=Cedecea neteri TaxID=158822 RepID=UPI00289EF948|nr:hypothetical protein [Cedecea neteri]